MAGRIDRRPFDEFDRLSNSVDRDEIASEVYEELSSIRTPDHDLEKLEREQKVREELEKLKQSTNKEQGLSPFYPSY